jgi:methylmalonyl-CoA mutase cobalamin-binding subunit
MTRTARRKIRTLIEQHKTTGQHLRAGTSAFDRALRSIGITVQELGAMNRAQTAAMEALIGATTSALEILNEL